MRIFGSIRQGYGAATGETGRGGKRKGGVRDISPRRMTAEGGNAEGHGGQGIGDQTLGGRRFTIKKGEMKKENCNSCGNGNGKKSPHQHRKFPLQNAFRPLVGKETTD